MNEQSIRDAYEAIAATAVSPERIRARIGARARVHRQRRMLLAGAGMATVAAAVGVPLTLHDRRGESEPPALGPVPEVPLLYTPGWLPDGVTERYRSVSFDTVTGEAFGATRRWYPEDAPYSGTVPAGSVGLVVGERMEPETSEPVTVGTARGIRWNSGDTAYVQWQPEAGPMIVVSAYGTADDEGNALRMARSVTQTAERVPITLTVTRDAPTSGTAVFEVYPAGFLTYEDGVLTYPDGWQPAGYQSLSYDGLLLATSPPETGTPFQAVERDGIMVYLTSDSGIGAEESMRILERVRCRPPDLTWVS
ncbi:hypothetical protein [Actinoplanes sp. NPDC023714]|uniref:hypothetical protein n=1 Tax=Actinoplanes sp. NPDC023714 TaxID=3154322 RepID=UPI00340D815B